MPLRVLACLLLALGSSACLSSLVPGDSPTVRWFSAMPAPGSVSRRPDAPPALRLRDVDAAAHLRERFVWRSSEVEYGFYESRRWTESPSAWLEAALAFELFEARGLRRSDAFETPSLDVQLTHFEERVGGDPRAQVAVVARLFDARGEALLERTFEANLPIERGGPDQVARALSHALGEVVREVASEVARLAAEVE